MSLVKCEKLENSMVELEFSTTAEEFKAAVDKVAKREAKKYTLPGFRKGKAPRHLIEKMYGADIFHYDAINDLFPAAYAAAVEEANVEPVSRPEADVVSSSLQDGVVLKAKVYVKPEITVGEYKGLKATQSVNAVEESRVDEEISRMQQRNGRVVTREGKAEKGDVAKFDFEGFVDGVAFEGGKAENYTLELGSGQFIPGFEDQMIGHEAGDEFDVNVTFPEEYHAKELAGKPAVFKIKLHEVTTKELPVLDDEFAKDVSEYDTLDELKASIRKGMEEQAEKEAELEVENALVDQVIETMQGDIPQVMFDNRLDEMVNDYRFRLEQQGLKLEMYLQYLGQTVEEFREGFKEQAEKQVKIRLALEAIAAQEKIEATEEEFEAEINRIAEMYKMEADKVKSLVNETEVKKDLAVNKVIDFIKENAKITKKAARKTAGRKKAAKTEEAAEETAE